MKTPKPVFKQLAWIASALLGCTLTLPAQSPPTITTQPASQTNLAGTTATSNAWSSNPAHSRAGRRLFIPGGTWPRDSFTR
jgi:hypothetical protein